MKVVLLNIIRDGDKDFKSSTVDKLDWNRIRDVKSSVRLFLRSTCQHLK